MAKYKIEVPNKLYSGVTEGVAFVGGYGETDNDQVKNVLINDYGYKLCCEDGKKKEEPKAEEPKSAPKKPTNNRKPSAK